MLSEAAKSSRVLGLLAFIWIQASVLVAAPEHTIRQYKFEVQQIKYRDDGRKDPFKLLARAGGVLLSSRGKNWNVHIGSLKLSSVITGKRKVAIFKESYGPTSYILVNGSLIGTDHKPIPGIAGRIESLNEHGAYRVILKQGVKEIEFEMLNGEASSKKTPARG